MRDHENTKDIHTTSTIARQAEPGITVPASAVAQAQRDAERTLEDLNRQVREMEQQRDGYVREACNMQLRIDDLKTLIGERILTLMAAKNA